MKRFFAALLVVLLALCALPAKFDGSATLNLGYDFGRHQWGFANGAPLVGDISATFGKGDGGGKGEADVYAEIQASYFFKARAKSDAGAKYETEFKINKAKLHFGPDWSLDIMSAGGDKSYAVAYWNIGDKPYDALKLGKELAPGFLVAYKDLSFGLGAKGNIGDKSYKIFAQAESPDLTLAKGMSLRVAAYGKLAEGGKEAGASAKFGFANDSLALNAAADFVYKGDAKVEAAAGLTVFPVTLNLYYTNKTDDNLNAKLALQIAKGLSAALDGRKLVSNSRSLGVELDARFAPVEIVASYGVTPWTWTHSAGLSLKYSHELFTLAAKADMGITCYDTGVKLTSLKPEVSITSNALVSRAEIGLAWQGADFGYRAGKKGELALYCKIGFGADEVPKAEPKAAQPVEAAPAPQEAAPKTDEVFLFKMEQNAIDKVLYFTGEMNGHFLATSENPDNAANMRMEEAPGGFRMCFKKAGFKNYIDIYEFEPGRVGVQITDTPTCVYNLDPELGVPVAEVAGGKYYLGAYKTYENISASSITYISGDNAQKIGVSQFPAMLVPAK